MPEGVLYPAGENPGCRPFMCPRVVRRSRVLPGLKIRDGAGKQIGFLPPLMADGTIEVWHLPGCLGAADLGDWADIA